MGDRAWLADWFGSEDEIPDACEVCDSGDPVSGVTGSWDEVLGACWACLLGDAVEEVLIAGPPSVFIAPVGTPFPDIRQGDPGQDWDILIWQGVSAKAPDYPPSDR